MSFRLKTILGVALIESVLLLILVVGGLEFLSESNERQLLQRAETATRLFTIAAKDAVLSTDLATLESLVDEALQSPDIVYVKILRNNIILAEGGDEYALQKPYQPDMQLANVSDHILDMHNEIKESGVVYGNVEMGLSTTAIEKTFEDAKQWTMGIAGIEIILVAIFSFILGTYLTRQLWQLKSASETVARSGPGHQVKVRGNDEIAAVANAFNAMSRSLKQSHRETRASIQSLELSVATAKRNEAYNKAILSASLDAMITITSKGDVVAFNDAATRIFGWQKEEIVGQPMHQYIVPQELRAAHVAGMQHHLETGEGPVLNKRLELPALHKNGHQFPIEISISPLTTDDKTMFTAFVRDISDQKAAETELRLAARTFDSDEAITITDRENKIIRVNNAFTRVTGYEAEEVLGKDHSFMKSGQHNKAFYQEMWQQLLEQGSWSGEIYNKRKNGEIFPEHLNISAVKDKKGETTHYVAHFVDISTQKENEEKLLQAQREAQAASNAKGLFLANMSHEIRTPMNGVLGILELLMDTRLDSKQQHLVQTGRASGAHLLDIINDILDYSKMDAERLELTSISFDLHALLDSVKELMKPQADKKHLTFSLEKSTPLVQYLRGDQIRLRQILLNLISNAIKFTERGGIRILVSSMPSKRNSSLLHIIVEDTGIGIVPEELDCLFEAFCMADQSHSRTTEGSGLGLAICKQLVSRMGGNIDFDSEVGVGSRFYFDVEIKNSDSIDFAIDHQANSLQITPREGTRVLLCEDNLANQAVIRAVLENARLLVDLACDGQEAVEAVRTGHYDIVLMDISMPLIDGIEATRLIRGLADGRGDLPIVALTAHALPGDRERFLNAGMNDYITKPIDKDAMLHVIALLTGDSGKLTHDIVENHYDTDYPDIEDIDELLSEPVLQQLARDAGADILPELLEVYTDDTRARVSSIEEAVTIKDYRTLKFEAHTLGSSAGAHGNIRLHKIAREIEQLCQEKKHEQATERAKLLIEIAEKSLQLLTERIAAGFV